MICASSEPGRIMRRALPNGEGEAVNLLSLVDGFATAVTVSEGRQHAEKVSEN